MINEKLNYNDMFKEQMAAGKPLLLHVCCAPCLATALYKLKDKEVVCLFYNPNILPKTEWRMRVAAVKKLVKAAQSGALGKGYEKLSLVVINAPARDFKKAIKGKEHLGEHSARCTSCIGSRLAFIFKYAKEHGFSMFATTLTSSAQKSAQLINILGKSIGDNMYVPSDFKKESGALASKKICQQLGLYRQTYCGCNLDNALNMPFKIGSVLVPSRLVLAPMAGYTDVGARHVAKLCGAGLTYTEMVSGKALVYKNEKTDKLLATTEIEKPKAVQLFGSDVASLVAAANLPQLEKFDIIDINMGCPMPKIVKNGDGSALMDNPTKAKEIIQALVKNVNKPVTVKFRKFEDDKKTLEFAKMCEKAGASAITIHPRTRSQLYSGVADREIVKKVAKRVSIPVILSGDVKSREEAEQVLVQTGATAVMIGRAVVGNPSIFGKEIAAKEAIMLHAKIDAGVLGERQTMLDLKKHLVAYFKAEKGAVELRKKLLAVNNLKELEECLEKI